MDLKDFGNALWGEEIIDLSLRILFVVRIYGVEKRFAKPVKK